MVGLQLFFAWFNKHDVAGIPADVLAHLFVGTVVYLILIRRDYPLASALVAVLGLALFKEFTIDLSALFHTGNYFEPIKDTFFTMLVPGLHAWVADFRLRGLSARRSLRPSKSRAVRF